MMIMRMYTRGAYGDPAMYVLSTTHTNIGVCQPAGRCTIIYYHLCMYMLAIYYYIYIYCENARSLVTHCA